MKKNLLIILTAFASIAALAQNRPVETKKDPNVFDEAAARAQAKAKNLKSTEIEGYVNYLRNDFSSKKALAKETHHHTPYEPAGTLGVQETVIYLEPGKPMSVGCPNMGFEQFNFTGWTGGIGTVSTGPIGGNPNYTPTGATIINTAGNNVSQANTINYHTILSLPPVDPNYLTINGYDSAACRAVGTQTISDIPFVSPFSFDPVSVRMNGTNSNYRACRLKYITTVSPTNLRLSFSYAVVLQNPSGHATEESPYFKVEVKNEATGVILPGCTSYTFNPKSSLPSDSLKLSVIGNSFDPTYYRKWQYYSVDLSSLPAGTNVSINFEVGGCTLGGHWGYAYVDAECGGIGTPYANMCSGSNFATLIAPTGFNNYQWYGPGGIIAGATNDTLIQSPATPGDTYTVTMVSPGGCALSQTVSIGFTTVNIINLNSTSSCPGGNSGTASVQANGSNGIYTYTWTNTSTGQVVSNNQTATGLAPGNYSVVVASTTCGQASANLSVGVSPPFFQAMSKAFCGNSTIIALAGGSNYQWYFNNTPVAAPLGNNDTMYINNATNGDIYTVVYNNAQGCRDSIKYTLNQIAGGSAYFSNTTNVCPNNTNGSTVLNLNTPFAAPYSYYVTGPTSSDVVLNTSSSSTTQTLSPLAPGTYTAVINDGTCIYNYTVAIGVIQTNFTITPTNTVLCFPEETTFNLSFGDVAPSTCGLSATGGCSTPNVVQIGNGTTVNSTTSYPAIYGNFYRNTRHQLLFRASELIAAGVQAGKLSSISFFVTTINGATAYPNFTIKMKCTTVNDLPPGSAFDNTGLVQVYNVATANITTGWNTYNFPNAYEWDGVSNLLVDVCNAQTASWTNNSSSPYTITPFNSVRWFNSDGTVACGNSTSSGYTPNTTYRPNVQFGNCGASAPSAYSVAVSSNGTVTVNYANDSLKVAPTFTTPPANGQVVYTFSVTNPVGGCVETKTIAVLYPPLTTSITTAVTNSTICEGDTTSLLAFGAYNYSWSYFQGGGLTPIATSSTINVTPPSVGLNTYVVTGNAPCPSATPDTKTVTVNVIPKANLIAAPLNNVVKCLNQPFILNVGVGSSTTGNAGTPYSYSWTEQPSNTPAPGATNSSTYSANSNNTTTYQVAITGSCAIGTTATVTVSNFVNDLGVSIIDSAAICPRSDFELNAISNGGRPNYNYNWTMAPSLSSISNTNHLSMNSPETEGTYTIMVTSTDSCGYVASDIQLITVLPPCEIVIPNVITPNGDGVNEYFKIKNLEYHPNTSLIIYDRWGKKVYESNNYDNMWKAEGKNDGTFFYILDVPDDKKYTGHITVFSKP